MIIRLANKDDLDSFYAISLSTGDYGSDASALYDDPKMMGHIYSAPYLTFSPELSFVVEDDIGVAGYIVGATNTGRFEDQLEREWWPVLRQTYAKPDEAHPSKWSADERRCFMIHRPERVPVELTALYPAHAHMNLLPRVQGRGIGPDLLDVWCTAVSDFGVGNVHVGVNGQNAGAVRFWHRNGFEPLGHLTGLAHSRIVWLGRSI